MNEITNNTATQTPIEIALGIDENGMTTARKLYGFLGLASGNYARWCESNIVKNSFAEENVDYWAFFINEEWGGQASTDYKLSAHFAKKLSMKGNGEKAEQAREYFTAVEEKMKQIAIDRSKLSPQLQQFYILADAQAQIELEQKRQAAELEQVKQIVQKANDTVTAVKEAVKPTLDNWRVEIVKKIRKVQQFCGKSYQDLIAESYVELERRAGCDLSTRLRNKRTRMQNEGRTKTDINNTRKIDCIEEDKKLREIYGKIVSEYEIRYCA